MTTNEGARWVPVIAQDPAIRRGPGGPILMAKIRIPAESLAPGPTGYRFQVVDYDATTRRYAGSHQIDRLPATWANGTPSIVDDPAFRAHNVYAVAMRTLARFEFALGRRIGWGFGNHQLKIAPAGMAEANAFYSREVEGLVFGYFRGASGKNFYTCLSHDVVAHETTHALLDGLRPRFLLPSHADQAAFHEGFADVIALLSVYSQREIVRELLRAIAKQDAIALVDVTPGALLKTALFQLAESMGAEVSGVRGEPLRQSAIIEPDRTLLSREEFQEPHRRGEILVAAVLRGFLAAWCSRIHRTVAVGQRRVSVTQVADEGSDIADALVTMWVRALDYLPPSDLEFPDALSAALTADFEVRPDDSRYELRKHVRETFGSYGIRPASPRREPEPGLWKTPPAELSYERVRFESMQSDKDEVFRFLWENRGCLNLQPDAYTEVLSVCPCMRVGMDGFTLRETVATYYQVARLTLDELASKGINVPRDLRKYVEKLPKHASKDDDEDAGAADGPIFAVYGGGTLIFNEFGRLKYRIHNHVFGGRQSRRLRYLWETGALVVDRKNARVSATQLSSLHRDRAVDATSRRKEW